jgi:uncharacterized protein (DUF924 family)
MSRFNVEPQTIIDFWFKEIEPKQWWVKDPEFDRLITDRFSHTHQQAQMGELWYWRETALGRLAEIIVLDQFPRNMYRDTAKAFDTDAMALVLAQEAVAQNVGQQLPNDSDKYKAFLYMPYMHSESIVIHEQAVKLFSEPGLEGNLDFELKHKAIIEQFGRYPHRNEILGRVSTDQELEFLKQPGSGF